MSARLHAPIIGFAMAVLVACAHQEPTLTKADLAGFSMELGFGKEDLNSFEKLEASFPVTLANPNALDGTVSDLQWVLRRAGKTIQSGTVDAVNLAAGETKELTVKVELDFSTLERGDSKILRTQFALVGFVEAEGARRKLLAKRPFEAVLPVRPALKVDAGIARYGTSRVEMLIGVEITNLNSFEIPVSSIDYTFNLDGEALKSGLIEKPRNLPAGAATAYDFSELLEATNKPEWVSKLASSKESIPFEMRMMLKNETESFELVYAGEMSLD